MRRSFALLLLAIGLFAGPSRAAERLLIVTDLPPDDRLFTEAFLP